MTRHRIARSAREGFLTAGALLGVVCILATIAGAAFGIKPLVFRSGSMSPAIHTGDLAVSRTVEASDLRRGDVVSVVNSSGNRVTHRLVNVAVQDDARQLTLKGDANTKADDEVYIVDRAEKVWFHIPKAGYVVDAAMSPVGLFVLGLYVAGMLALVLRRRSGGPHDGDAVSSPRGGARRAEKPGRTRAAARTTAAVVVGAGVMIATPAIAAPWTDVVPITGTTLTARTVPPPTNLQCTTTGFLVTSANLTWTSAGTGYSYLVEVRRVSNGAVEASFTTAATSYSLTGTLLGNLASTNFTASVNAFPTGVATWRSTGPTTPVNSRTLGAGMACGDL